MSRAKPTTQAVRAARQRTLARVAERAGPSVRVSEDPKAPGGARVDLAVAVADIPTEGLAIQEELPAAWITELIDGEEDSVEAWWATAPAAIDVSVEKEGSGLLRLTGEGRFALSHACVRCLQPLSYEFEIAYDLRMAEGRGELVTEVDLDPDGLAALVGDDDMAVMGDDDEDYVTFQGDAVDLARVLREQLLLELPMHPRCGEDGAQSEGPCEYDPEGKGSADQEKWVDPRWEGLLALKDRLKN